MVEYIVMEIINTIYGNLLGKSNLAMIELENIIRLEITGIWGSRVAREENLTQLNEFFSNLGSGTEFQLECGLELQGVRQNM